MNYPPASLPLRIATLCALIALPLGLRANTADARVANSQAQSHYAELKITAEDGSSYRTPKEDWEGARQRVAEDPQWAKWLQGQHNTIDKWMARHKDRTDWVCGVWSRFVSPKDGSFLVWTDDIPGEETDYLMSRTGHRVEVTETIKQSWVYGFRQRHFRHMRDAARLYRLTGEEKYAQWAADQLDFYADNEDQFPVRNVGGTNYVRLGGASLTDANYLTDLIETARILFDYAGEERRQHWFDHLFKPEAELLNMSMQTIHNIAVWQRSAQAQVALLYDKQDIWDRVVDGKYGLREQLQQGVTADYLWYEQSMGYNSYVVNATRQLFLFAGLVGKKEQLSEEAAILQNMMLTPFFIRFEDGTLPNPADIYGIPKVPVSALAASARVFPTVIGIEAAAELKNWNSLLDPLTLPEGIEASAYPEVVSLNMEPSRFALLKDENWQLFFHYGQLLASHSQAEALNWSATYKGTVISQDMGTVGYGAPLHREYYSKGLAHNVPLVNGEGQEPWHPGELLSFVGEGDVLEVRAAQPNYRKNASASRTLTIANDVLTEETTLSLNPGSAPALLGLNINLAGEPTLGEAFKPVADFASGRPAAFKYWETVRAAKFNDKAEFDVTFADGLVLRVTFETKGPFTLYQGAAPERLPSRRAGFYLEKDDKGTLATFKLTFTPVKSDAP